MIENVLIVLFFALIIRHIYIHYRSAKRSIDTWVAENNLKVLSKERRKYETGPYFPFQYHFVYKMVVQSPNGEKSTCWIQCNRLFGLSPSYFEVIFENNLGSSSVDNDLHAGTAEDQAGHRDD